MVFFLSQPTQPSLHGKMAALAQARGSFVHATVVDTGGSTPRLAGAQMVIEQTAIWGTIGGGTLEHRVIIEARALLDNPRKSSTLYSVHLVRDLAMCCGGKRG